MKAIYIPCLLVVVATRTMNGPHHYHQHNRDGCSSYTSPYMQLLYATYLLIYLEGVLSFSAAEPYTTVIHYALILFDRNVVRANRSEILDNLDTRVIHISRYLLDLSIGREIYAKHNTISPYD